MPDPVINVGKLREMLAAYDDDQPVMLGIGNLLFRFKVERQNTIDGLMVVIEQGDHNVGL